MPRAPRWSSGGADGAVPAEAAPSALADDASPVAPPVVAAIPVAYLDPAAPWASRVGAATGGTRLRAHLAARVSIRFDDTKAAVDEVQEYEALYGPLDNDFALESETTVDFDDRDFRTDAPSGAHYVLPHGAGRTGVVLPRRGARDQAPARGHADARAPAERPAEAGLASWRDARGVPPALRRGGASRSRRRGGQDPRPARDQAGQVRRPRSLRRSDASRSSRPTSARGRRTSSSPAPAPSSARSSAAGGVLVRSRTRWAPPRPAAA